MTRPWRQAIQKEYARLAGEYDSRWSFYVEAGVRETLQRLRAKPSDRVLDVGCGTGALLHALSTSCPGMQLVGVDASPAMLAIARRRLGPSLELQVGWAESLPYPSESFDIVVSSSVFHYLREPALALQEWARVLRPGGRIVITDWCDDYLGCRVCDRLLRLFNAAYFRTYGVRECGAMLDALAIGPVTTERYKISWLWGLMTVVVRRAVLNSR